MTTPTTSTHCHCGAAFNGSDHCPECYCEQFEATCDHVYEPAVQDARAAYYAHEAAKRSAFEHDLAQAVAEYDSQFDLLCQIAADNPKLTGDVLEAVAKARQVRDDKVAEVWARYA